MISFEMFSSRVTFVRPPADVKHYLDGMNLVKNIDYIMMLAVQVSDDEESSVEE